MKQFNNLTISLVFSFLAASSYFLVAALPVSAQYRLPQASAPVQVQAAVGEFHLDLAGWIAPYASVLLTTDGVFMRATVADDGGNFSISQVRIKRGFKSFCLTAVDFKQLGESLTCFTISPAQDNVSMRDIFLPPTLGLYRSEIAAGGEALAFGYTMPRAKVTLHIDAYTLTAIADEHGYYEFRIKNVSAGTHKLFATAEYKGRQSLQPSRVLSLHAMSWWEQVMAFLRDLWKKFIDLITSWGLGPLWFAMPMLILIIILIVKLWPERFTWIYESKLVALLPRSHRRRLHHWWFVGY